MKKVGQIDIKRGMSVDALIREYGKASVLGAGKLAEACSILEEMVAQRATVLLGISGPMAASGLRKVVADLTRKGIISGVVTSGANIVHDVIEALGGFHIAGEFRAVDRELRKKAYGRIGNIYARDEDFTVFEDFTQGLLKEQPREKLENLSPRELVSEIGRHLEDESSFIRAAYEREVPVYSPGITDSMLGLQLFFFSQGNSISLNMLKDMKELATQVLSSSRVGGVFLGGGVPKHYIMGANLLREGLDYAVQITLDREEAGSLSGAKLEEGMSWGKTAKDARVASVTGDATILFPLMVASLMERLR